MINGPLTIRLVGSSDGATPHVTQGGSTYWLLDGRIHRGNDLPAIIHPDGTRFWYSHGLCHRPSGGPAIEWADGTRDWYEHGHLVHRVGANHHP